MTTRITISQLRVRFIILFFLILASLFFSLSVRAETISSESAVKKYNISFPVVELGSCNSLAECKMYCEDSAHREACTNFAKKKGFYKLPQSQVDLITKAKAELGCNSADECRQFCGLSENWERCGEFAKKYRLSQTQKIEASGSASQIKLKRAKEILGCDGLENCKRHCSIAQNFDICRKFLAQMENESDNDEDKRSIKPPNVSDKCLEIKKVLEQKGVLPPVALEQYKRYCVSSGNQGTGEKSTRDATVEVALEYCRKFPEKCKELLKNSGAILECSKKPGCYFSQESNVCKCVASGSEIPSDLKNYSEVVEEYAKICTQKGCTWSGASCSCPISPTSNSSVDYLKQQYQACVQKGCTPSTYPGGLNCKCSGVQGVSTELSLFDKVLNFLSGK